MGGVSMTVYLWVEPCLSIHPLHMINTADWEQASYYLSVIHLDANNTETLVSRFLARFICPKKVNIK